MNENYTFFKFIIKLSSVITRIIYRFLPYFDEPKKLLIIFLDNVNKGYSCRFFLEIFTYKSVSYYYFTLSLLDD